MSLCSDPFQSPKFFVRRHCVPLERSCTPSSAECSSSNGLVDHLEQEDIVSFSADSALHLSPSVKLIMFATQSTAALSTYRMRLKSDDTLAYCAPCCLLATVRQMCLEPSCACVALMLIVVVLQGVCSWTNAFSCSRVGVPEQWNRLQRRCF